MTVENTYDFHGKLLVKLSRDRRYPFFDSYLDQVFSRYETSSSREPDLVIRLDSEKPVLKNGYWVDGKYCVRENSIGYENRFKSGRWTVLIEGLESAKTSVHIGSNIFARPVLAGETLYSLIRYKLAQKGCALLHASGIGVNGRGLAGLAKSLVLVSKLVFACSWLFSTSTLGLSRIRSRIHIPSAI